MRAQGGFNPWVNLCISLVNSEGVPTRKLNTFSVLVEGFDYTQG